VRHDNRTANDYTSGGRPTVGRAAGGGEGGEGKAHAKDERTAKPEKPKVTPSREKQSSVPQKASPVPQNNQGDFIDDSDLEDGFEDFAGNSNWRVEQRFYTKKDGTVMLYWNYRSRTPIYINGERKIAYKPGGKKLWRQSRAKKTRMK